VIITLDTTRADRLSPYGFMNVSLPHLERLARNGIVFDNATSVAPLTLPAHTSLFTGLVPPAHGVRDNASAPLSDDRVTLAERMRDAGFRTGAFVGSIVLDPERGLQQGFETYRGVPRDATDRRQRRGEEVVDDAVAWLEAVGGDRFFLWTHLYDPHRPYDAPEPYGLTYAHNPYVGEIAYADAQIGRLLDALERRRLLDRTLVIVTADHGESLGAHGERDHGIFIYEDVIRVPLIVRGPGLRPARVGEVVRLIDLMPTVLDIAGAPVPHVDGVSLTDLLAGRQRAPDLTAYAESLYPERFGWSALRSVRHGNMKFIDAPRPEVYDLADDPFEMRNLYDERRATAEMLGRQLAAFTARREGGHVSSRRSDASPEVQAKLAALGYLTLPPRVDQPETSRPDPKDCIGSRSNDTVSRQMPPACQAWAGAAYPPVR
jgi:arylsulfatase A-like enzyme